MTYPIQYSFNTLSFPKAYHLKMYTHGPWLGSIKGKSSLIRFCTSQPFFVLELFTLIWRNIPISQLPLLRIILMLYARPGGIINSRPSLPLDFKFFNSGVMSLDLPARFKFCRFPFNTLQM